MTKKQYFENLQKVFTTGLNLMKMKNADYAGDKDPFKNFRLCETLGITVEEGILVRMSDKLARIGNLLKNESKVSTESIQDTLIDLMNYSAILLVWMEPKYEQKDLIDEVRKNVHPVTFPNLEKCDCNHCK